MEVFECYSCQGVCRKPHRGFNRAFDGFVYEAFHLCPACGDDSCIPRPATTGEALSFAWGDLKEAILAAIFPWMIGLAFAAIYIKERIWPRKRNR
jgi:hypothetical protein